MAKTDSPSQLIDARIKELSDWRGDTLARIRKLIKQADPDVVEEWKWRGVPTWYHDGMICTGETYADKVKVTFAKGASLDDPSGLFNSSLDGNTRRAIDFHEGDKIDEKAFMALVRAAVDLNRRDEQGHEEGHASPAQHAADSHDLIRVHGARENNLKDVNLEFPKRRLTVFTGVSGSGKSSLVFDTIAAESQRLINETYSAFVQGFMPTLARPDVDVLEGLTTAIIVDQERMGADPRSTVGTATDANAMLRILFSRLGNRTSARLRPFPSMSPR